MAVIDPVDLIVNQVVPGVWNGLRQVGEVGLGIAVGLFVLPRGWRLFQKLLDGVLRSGRIAGWSETSDEIRRREAREARTGYTARDERTMARMQKRLSK